MVRRVVTGNDDGGRSFFVSDGETPHRWDLGRIEADDVWVDDAQRRASDNEFDPVADGYFSLVGPEGGSVVRVVTFFPPDRADPPSEEALAEARAHWDSGAHMESDDPAMHTTATIDYGIVLEGEIGLELDSGEVSLRAGDIVVQRATRHAWRNRSGRPVRMLFVLIGSPPYEATAP
jgi:mannose-6-phosphate isomerase-like protein (cupin superfamily)